MSFFGTDNFYTPPGTDPTAIDPTATPGGGNGSEDGRDTLYHSFEQSGPVFPGDSGNSAAATSGTDTDTQKRMLDAAMGVDASLANGTYGGGAPTGPAANTATIPGDYATGKLATDAPTGATPAVPTIPGETPPAPGSGGGSGQLSDPQWQKDFMDKFGYYDPNFNSRENMLANAQRGDSIIKPQLDYMAQFDSDAARLSRGINAAPDFYHSQNAYEWAGQHNAQVEARIAAMEQGGQPGVAQRAGFTGPLHGSSGAAPTGYVDQAAINNLRGQEIRPFTPIDNAHALLTDQMRTGIADALASLGATNIKQTIDSYGHLALDFTSASGQQRTIPETLVNYANTLEQLKSLAPAAPAANPAAAGNGGTAPPARGNAPSARGYAPPQTPAAPPQTGGGGGGGAGPNSTVTAPTGIPGAAFGTNAQGQTVGGPYGNRMGPMYDEFGNPYGKGYVPPADRYAVTYDQ